MFKKILKIVIITSIIATLLYITISNRSNTISNRRETSAISAVPREMPNDPYFEKQLAHHFNMLNIPEAWEYTVGCNEILIAILDTGIDLTHPDFEGLTVQWHDVLGISSEPIDVNPNQHGTGVAGVIAARTNNSIGISGVTWKNNLLVVRVREKNERITGTSRNLAKGIKYAVDNGARIISITTSFSRLCSELENAVDYAYNNGVLIVSSRGNHARNVPRYPASHPNVLGVGGLDFCGTRRDSHSSYGKGLDVMSFFKSHRVLRHENYATVRGTSFATPQVVSLAAMLLSLNPDLTPAEVKQYIIGGSVHLGNTPGWCEETGWGRINFLNSIQLLKEDMGNNKEMLMLELHRNIFLRI